MSAILETRTCGMEEGNQIWNKKSHACRYYMFRNGCAIVDWKQYWDAKQSLSLNKFLVLTIVWPSENFKATNKQSKSACAPVQEERSNYHLVVRQPWCSICSVCFHVTELSLLIPIRWMVLYKIWVPFLMFVYCIMKFWSNTLRKATRCLWFK